MFLSFADVMCFFISVYLLVGASEEYQNILFLLLKRREILDLHRCGIPSYFSFPKQLFIAPILSFQKFASITESSFFNFGYHSWCHFWCHIHYSWCHPLLLECHSLSLEYHYLSFGFIFGVHSKFWGSYYRTCYH